MLIQQLVLVGPIPAYAIGGWLARERRVVFVKNTTLVEIFELKAAGQRLAHPLFRLAE
jgi:hypothetical protein